MTDKPTVSMLGTGIMGAAMARNLCRAGLDVRAWIAKAADAAQRTVRMIERPIFLHQDHDVFRVTKRRAGRGRDRHRSRDGVRNRSESERELSNVELRPQRAVV